MELEALKATWKSLNPEINNIGLMLKDSSDSLSKKIDVRTRLLRKILIGEIFSSVCLIMLATSLMWSPTAFPGLWLAAFCCISIIGIIYGIWLYLAVRHIDLWKNTNAEILAAIIKIKKSYWKIELIFSCFMIPLMLWLSLTPPFVNTPDMYIVWGLTALGFSMEYLWYRSNIKQLNIINS